MNFVSNPNEIVRPLTTDKYPDMVPWDPLYTFKAGDRVILDLHEWHLAWGIVDRTPSADPWNGTGLLAMACLQMIHNGMDLPLPSPHDDDDIASEGDIYVERAALRILHGRRGVVLGVDIGARGGYTSYLSVELWGGATLVALSAFHLRLREGR